uniref:NADH dehydrogenase subunit 6 n=1 Tax=Holarthrothrips indicus TaxID=1965675 RepID=A0A8A5L5L2_9NEOP|nr:NADH dehydrogenase subunit 6 [Holarthrothrips indicus]
MHKMLLIFLLMFITINMVTETFPMMLGFYVLSQAFLYSILMSSLILYSWFSYLLFIIMLGGLLILFIYVISTINDEITNYKSSKMFLVFLSLIMLLLSLYSKNSIMILNNTSTLNKYSNMEMLNFIYLLPLMSVTNSKITIYMFLYLFLTMIVVVWTVDVNKSSMRYF